MLTLLWLLLITAKNDRGRKSFANIPLLVLFSCTDQAIFELAEIFFL